VLVGKSNPNLRNSISTPFFSLDASRRASFGTEMSLTSRRASFGTEMSLTSRNRMSFLSAQDGESSVKSRDRIGRSFIELSGRRRMSFSDYAAAPQPEADYAAAPQPEAPAAAVAVVDDKGRGKMAGRHGLVKWVLAGDVRLWLVGACFYPMAQITRIMSDYFIRCSCSPQTPNPKPQTPNPKPQTPNPKPQTPKPNPQPPTPHAHQMVDRRQVRAFTRRQPCNLLLPRCRFHRRPHPARLLLLPLQRAVCSADAQGSERCNHAGRG